MKPRSRSLSGAVIAVLALPVFMGLLACIPSFPVPVGDPEKSTIDPYISGIWLIEEDEVFYVFEPYDKRTWLLSAFEVSENLDSCEVEVEAEAEVEVEAEAEAEIETEELNSYDELMADIVAYGTECFDVERGPGALKVWRTRLGGEWFMTWEDKGVFDAETGFAPQEWLVFRIDTTVPDQLRLGWIDMDHAAWDKIADLDEEDVTRRAIEKVIRKHADEEDFYEDDDESIVFYRVLPEHYYWIEDFLDANIMD